MAVSSVSAATPAPTVSASPPNEARVFAQALIDQNKGRYGEIVRQLDAMQSKPETVEFGKAVEAELRQFLGPNAARLDSAIYTIDGQRFSRNGDTPAEIRAAAVIDAKRPVAARTGAYDRYMAEDRRFGDGKFATNDTAKIEDGWRSMIAAGAKTPAEYTRLARAADQKLNSTITDFQKQFSAGGLGSLIGDKLGKGLLNGLTQGERVEGKDMAQDIGVLLQKGPEIYAAFQIGVAKGAAGAAWEMLSSLATLAGKTIQLGGDTVGFGVLGRLGDAARSAIPQSVKDAANSVGAGAVFDAATPSFTRGVESQKAIAGISAKVVTYFQTRSADQIGQDAVNALDAKWESIKGEFHALNGDPVKQAEWLGKQVGAVAFEVASTVIPVTKIGTAVRVADKAADAARVLDKGGDVAKGLDKTGDAARVFETLLDRGRRILGDLPLNSKSLDDLYRAGSLSMDEARALAKSVGFKDDAGRWIYPPNDGFAGVRKPTTLAPPIKLDRYGGFADQNGKFSDTGNFFSPDGNSYGSRALPPGTAATKPFKTYEVLQPFDSISGKATAWFDEVGGGIQHMTKLNVEILVQKGYIRELK
jgi:Tuberculosis necrotizing toxin